MSADNGIYILETGDHYDNKEYRVAYQMAVDNYLWDNEKNERSNDPDVWIRNAREMWKGCKVFTDSNSAVREAERIYQEFMKDDLAILEYGIVFIEVPRHF